MRCKIADLITEIPDTGGLAPRVQEYLWDSDDPVDIHIRESSFRIDVWKRLSYDLSCYMESGIRFYADLLRFEGLMLHASAVVYDGRAYLFSGPSGIGKSTHTKLWIENFGNQAVIINDDKPALRFLDGQWYAYGTPWCGKDGINQNMKAPLAGICFLEQGEKNAISLLPAKESVYLLIMQTLHGFATANRTLMMLRHVENLVTNVPVYKMINQPTLEAARLSYETMRYYAKG